MANLQSPPRLRVAYQVCAEAARIARKLRRLDVAKDRRYPVPLAGYDFEGARLRLDENRKVRELAWEAHQRLWGA